MRSGARFPMCARDHTGAISSNKRNVKSRLKGTSVQFCGTSIGSPPLKKKTFTYLVDAGPLGIRSGGNTPLGVGSLDGREVFRT